MDDSRQPHERRPAARGAVVGRCLEILTEIKAHSCGDVVFPGRTGHNPLAAATFRWLLAKLGHTDVTVHGFRSSFRDWCGERTNFPREIAEAALEQRRLSWTPGRGFAPSRQSRPMWCRCGGARHEQGKAGGPDHTAIVLRESERVFPAGARPHGALDPPVGGTFHFENLLMPPLPKPVQKWFCRIKG